MSIYKKLTKVQSELKAPKGQFNSFGKYKYRNCEDILESLKPLLKENNLSIILGDEICLVGERYYVKAIVTLVDNETGEKIENTAFAREEESKKGMDGSQVTGASSSYARKYALNGLFGIDDTKDSDTTNSGETTTPKRQTQTNDVKCEKCDRVLMPFTDAKGKEYTVEDLVAGSQKTFGQILCRGCMKK